MSTSFSKLLFAVVLTFFSAPFASAQILEGLLGRETPPERWGSVAAGISTFGQGAMLGYGQRALFGENADARFSVAYARQDFGEQNLGLEVAATALSYTYRPDTSAPRLFLVPYGGIGPRLLVQGGVYDYNPADFGFGTSTAVSLNIGALGGLEARLQSVGIFLELDLSLPAVGLIGSRFAFFPLAELTIPKLALGSNLYF